MIWELYEKCVGIQNIIFITCTYDILKYIVKKNLHIGALLLMSYCIVTYFALKTWPVSNTFV